MPVQNTNPNLTAPVVDSDYYAGIQGGSGIEPVSGINTSADSSGPWFIEEQTLDFIYQRVPNVSFNITSGLPLDLDSATASFDIKDTCLVLKGRAKYSVTKSYRFYSTSGYQQGQKFEVVATSADYLGESYGEVSSGTLGPGGEVNTTQKYLNRRLWNASSDSETIESVRFLSVFETNDSGVPNGSVGNKFGRYEYWWLNDEFTCPIQGINSTVKGFIDIITKNGPYAAAQDSTKDVVRLLDTVGDTLQSKKFFAKKASTGYTQDGGDTGISQYRSDRHTYI